MKYCVYSADDPFVVEEFDNLQDAMDRQNEVPHSIIVTIGADQDFWKWIGI